MTRIVMWLWQPVAWTLILSACANSEPPDGDRASGTDGAPRTTVPGGLAVTTTAGTGRCATAEHAGGQWPSLNGDHSNTRNQSKETQTGVARARQLQPRWSFNSASVGATGGMRTTPVIASGCVYIALGQGYLGEIGDIIALNADSGELVWHARVDASVLGIAADSGMIYVSPSKGTREVVGDVALPVVTGDYVPAGSYLLALDAQTGRLQWLSERLDNGDPHDGTFINASPVVFEAGGRRMVFTAMAGGSGDGARIPMYFLDAQTGETIRKAYALADAEYAEGYGGTGIWSTAAYDPATQHLYAGTSDSDSHTKQHPYNDAILKIDANPLRATFASVVAGYSGVTEHANLDPLVEAVNPLCQLFGPTAAIGLITLFDTSASALCLELDLDFGASPNLYAGADGGLRVGALQKAGVYHSVDTRSMQADWQTLISIGGPAMSSGTAAVVGTSLYVDATPNLVFRVAQTDGTVQWLTLTEIDALAYQPVSAASGVIYTINNLGSLLAFDGSSGLPILSRSIAADGGFVQCLGVGAGVAIARNMVYAPCDAGGLHDLAGLPHTPGGLVAYQ